MPKYPIPLDLQKALDNAYTYHPPKEDQPERYVTIRSAAHDFALVICQNAPQSRERAIGLTLLEEVVCMVNKAIACNE